MGEDGAGSDDYDPNADPKADPRERRRIRYEYRELIAETQKNRHDFIKPESTGLHQALDKADNLFKGVRLTREAVLDSHFLVLASNLGSQQAQQLQTHLVTFDPDTFVQKLITFMGGRNIADASRDDDEDEDMPSRRPHPPPRLDWKKLGQKASVAFRRTPNVDFMLGPLSMEPPRRLTRESQRRPQRRSPTVLVKPTQLEKVESREEATTKEVERLHNVLYENTVTENDEVNPVCLFKFIINPHSFGQTIENLFHLSFLVRDGRADIRLEDELPVVSYEEMGGENEETIKKQVVVHLTLQEYKEIIKTFNITEPMIPPRPRMNHVNSAGPSNHRNHNNNDNEEEEEEDDN